MKLPAYRRNIRSGLTFLWMMAFTVILPPIAWAQRGNEEAEPETNAKWLLAYCLVGLLIGLSVYSMCRPSLRRKKDGTV